MTYKESIKDLIITRLETISIKVVETVKINIGRAPNLTPREVTWYKSKVGPTPRLFKAVSKDEYAAFEQIAHLRNTRCHSSVELEDVGAYIKNVQTFEKYHGQTEESRVLKSLLRKMQCGIIKIE